MQYIRAYVNGYIVSAILPEADALKNAALDIALRENVALWIDGVRIQSGDLSEDHCQKIETKYDYNSNQKTADKTVDATSNWLFRLRSEPALSCLLYGNEARQDSSSDTLDTNTPLR